MERLMLWRAEILLASLAGIVGGMAVARGTLLQVYVDVPHNGRMTIDSPRPYLEVPALAAADHMPNILTITERTSLMMQAGLLDIEFIL
jgi:hypothetical protein